MVWVVALTAYLWRRRLTRKRRDGTGGARYLRLGAVAMCGLAAACAVLGGYAWRHRDDTARGTGLRLWALVRSPEDGTNVFEEAFEAARRIQPANYYLYSLKATQLLRQEQPAAAAPAGLHFVNRALFLHPGYAPAHRLAAELLLAAGRRSQGFLELRLALLDTKHRQKRHALLERGLSVRGSLEDLVEIAGDSDELRRDMLSFLTSTRRPGLAYRAMKLMQFAETARGDPDGEYVVVQVLHGAERLQELSQFVEGVLERRPASVWALLWAARLDRRAGRLDRALERVRRGRAVAEHPVRLERLLREEARILELLGDVEGLHRLIRALETPRSALATLYYRRAMLYLAREQTGPALADLRLAEQLDPETAYATRAIAQILEKLASLEAAAHAYEEVLRRDPKDEKAREALARVRAAQQKRRLEGLMRGAGTPTPGPEPAEEPDRATTD